MFSNPLELCLLSQICFVCLMLSFIDTCLVFVASTECKICFLCSMAMHLSVTICDTCALDHVARDLPPFLHTASSLKLEVGKAWE